MGMASTRAELRRAISLLSMRADSRRCGYVFLGSRLVAVSSEYSSTGTADESEIVMTEAKTSLVDKLLTESGEMWKAAKDRTKPENYVIVCDWPNAGWRAWINANGEWISEVHKWTEIEMADFHAKFGKDGWAYLVGSIMPINGGPAANLIRGFVYNGRHDGWNVSVEKTTVAVGVADSQ